MNLYDLPRLYDLMCPRLADDEPELGWWRRACALGGASAAGGLVLELGAGTGRLAIALARAGLRVTALERAPAMLARGRAHAEAAGVALTWVEGDMTALALDRRFEAILLPFNTLMHLHTAGEHAALFAGIHAHLAPGGVLALSVTSPDPRTLGRAPDHRLRVAGPIDDPVEGTPLYVDETIAYDHASQCTRGAFRFSYPGRVDAVVAAVDLRMFYPEELLLLLAHHGLDVVARHGDWDDSPFTSASLSQHVICRAAPP